MSIQKDWIETKSFGEVYAKNGSNGRVPYEHQKDAMECMDIIDREKS